MRGIHRNPRRSSRCRRFIPAHAGNSRQGDWRPARVAVHPRACGEFPSTCCGRSTTPRFIPAHAGNSGQRPVERPRYTVHPRACGEFRSSDGRIQYCSGSSPRMRGIQLPLVNLHQCARFIPAHAGNSAVRGEFVVRHRVHPRACGEFGEGVPGADWVNGSSPRMRGIRFGAAHRRHDCRFIPAHAGNSVTRALSPMDGTVHPRACGEFRACSLLARGSSGSSPRMRGILRP